MAIPCITHQTSATSEVPVRCRPFRERILSLHPDWEHRFYDDYACRELVRQEFPYLLSLYDGYTAAIQRVDLFRIAAVYRSGGFYLDLDIVCHKSLDVLSQHVCVLGEEKTLSDAEKHRLGHQHALRVSNYMFGSEARHPFWLDVLDEMLEQAPRTVGSENDILESTGPGLLTNVYHRVCGRYPELLLLRNNRIACPSCGGIACQFGEFASHLHIGSWRWEHAAPYHSPPRPMQRSDSDITRQAARWLLHAERGVRSLGKQFAVLQTYTEDTHDGVTSIYSRVRGLAQPMVDTRGLTNRCVLVAGLPFLYTDKLSPRNRNIVYTTFESTQLASFWLEAINACYNLCVVPHESVRSVFADSGVRIPLVVIQQGFTRYQCATRRRPPRDVFRIGFLGAPVQRKNLHKLYEACLPLLGEIADLRLCVHVSKYYDWMDRRIWDRVKTEPFVEWSEGVLSSSDLALWYQNLSCYVVPSSGEGWSFTPREAMYLGIPTVLTSIPVHQELTDSGYCTVIPTDGLEPAVFEGAVFGQWSRVRVEDISQAILDVYRTPKQIEHKAYCGAKWIEDKWLNADVRRKLADLMQSV